MEVRVPMEILYHDNHLLVVNKPAGRLVQGDQTGRPTLLDDARAWIRREYQKPGNVYVGLVHRLDRPVSGVVVLARTSKAAARLSEQFRNRRPRKVYWALVEGRTPESGEWIDQIVRDGPRSRVVDANGGAEARLQFRRHGLGPTASRVEVDLHSGRHHQIRVQFAHRGHPVLGDRRYGAISTFVGDTIALHARTLVIAHPTTKEELTYSADLPSSWYDRVP